MSLFDKVKQTANQVKDTSLKIAEEKGVTEKLTKVKNASLNFAEEKGITDILNQTTDAITSPFKEASEEKKPLEGCIQWYEVLYEGGLPYIDPKMVGASKGAIGMNIMPDSFYFKPTYSSKGWFADLEIPYDDIKKFELIKRSVSNAEMLLSSNAASAAALATLNTMAITYIDNNGEEIYLKMEMLSGLSVQGQAKKCEAMMDILRINKILPRLNKEPENNRQLSAISAADEIKKFKALLDDGIISQEEFDLKKKQLLGL